MRKISISCLVFIFISLASPFVLACHEPELVEDINGDGIVDIIDIMIVAEAFASYPGHPRWNSNADVDGSNSVNIGDVIQVLNAFGTSK